MGEKKNTESWDDRKQTNKQTTMFFLYAQLFQAPFGVYGGQNSDAQNSFFFFKVKKNWLELFCVFYTSFDLLLLFVQGKNRISSCTKWKKYVSKVAIRKFQMDYIITKRIKNKAFVS